MLVYDVTRKVGCMHPLCSPPIESACAHRLCSALRISLPLHMYSLQYNIHTMVQFIPLRGRSPAVLIMHCLPQILVDFSLHVTVSHDSVWVSSFSTYAVSVLNSHWAPT